VIKDPVVGDLIDQRYVLTREIARGGMGRVFEAEQRETGRAVALKIVHRRSRFVRISEEQLLLEAQAIAAARHPGIVELLDVGVCAVNGPYLALEMLVGRTLDGIIASRRSLPIEDVVHIGRQMCDALAFCHERNIVHRDLKPSNVFVALEGGREVVKLFDFGIAALGGAGDASAEQDAFGTPEYMAPEQLFADGAIDHRVDVYAAGVTLFECLTGEVPYPGTAAQVVAQLADRTRPVPRVRATLKDFNVDLDEVLAMAIALAPERRFSSASAFVRALGLASGLEAGTTCLLGEATPSMLEALDRSSRPSLPGAPPSDGRVQRLFERVPYVTVTEINHGDGAFVGHSEDISLGGMLVRATASLPAQAKVKVTFQLPGVGRSASVQANVRWSRAARGGEHAIGLQFLDLANDCRKAILDFVRNPSGAEAGGTS